MDIIFHGLIDERVRNLAAMIDDVVEGFEDTIWQPVLSHELPGFYWLFFGRAKLHGLAPSFVTPADAWKSVPTMAYNTAWQNGNIFSMPAFNWSSRSVIQIGNFQQKV
jgi:hypothetical protein